MLSGLDWLIYVSHAFVRISFAASLRLSQTPICLLNCRVQCFEKIRAVRPFVYSEGASPRFFGARIP